jgi:hypothetical protein
MLYACLCYPVPPTWCTVEELSIPEMLFLERQSLQNYGFFKVSEIRVSLKGHLS